MNLRVMMDGREVGRLSRDAGTCYFAYSREWLESGFPISPRSLPLEDRLFSGRDDRFEGLQGVFADSMPGGWGMFTVIRALRKRGVDYTSLDPLDKLTYIDANGLGALYYEPASDSIRGALPERDLDAICEDCMAIRDEGTADLDDIFKRAGSTGGARPKVNMEIDGTQWIVKFRERNDPEWMGRMEYEYNLAARECGIDVPECRLMDSKLCEGYFASKRFDRVGDRRIHMLSLGGLLEVPNDMPLLDYVSFLQATMFVTNSVSETLKAFRLSCFNVFAKNFDDHSKNFAYLYLPEKGGYVLSPAFDLTRTPGMGEHHMTCMGNPLPGRKELSELADVMRIPKNRAEGIIADTEETVSELLGEWIQN